MNAINKYKDIIIKNERLRGWENFKFHAFWTSALIFQKNDSNLSNSKI